MEKYIIEWCGLDYKQSGIIMAASLEEANNEAYERACEDYQNYEGLYGLRSESEIMEDEECDEETAYQIYIDEIESLLQYEAYPYDEKLIEDLEYSTCYNGEMF